MATLAFSTFLKDVLPIVKGCPQPMVIDALRDAARELCERAPIWRDEVDSIMYVAGVAEYDLSAPDNTEIVQVVEVYQNGYGPLQQITEQALSAADPRWKERTSNQPTYYIHPAIDVLRIVSIPSVSATTPLVIKGWLQPSLSATEMDSKVLTKWRDHIVYGAKARLLALTEVSWSNPAMASYYAVSFETSKAKAAGYALSQSAGGTLSVRSRPLGG